MSFMSEFKEFINKGNAMDMAVGVIVGGAFTAIVTSLTTDIINPFIKLVTSPVSGGEEALSGLVIPVPGMEGGIDFSAFIAAIINFIIVAFVVFCLVKALNGMQNVGKKVLDKDGNPVEEAPAPTCPYCLEEVKEGATRCPHCAGDIASYKA
jgi:large conductance mechanosensitive channel